MQFFEVYFRNGEVILDAGLDEADVVRYMKETHAKNGPPIKVQVAKNWTCGDRFTNEIQRPMYAV
jgi:hypothetical protein